MAAVTGACFGPKDAAECPAANSRQAAFTAAAWSGCSEVARCSVSVTRLTAGSGMLCVALDHGRPTIRRKLVRRGLRVTDSHKGRRWDALRVDEVPAHVHMPGEVETGGTAAISAWP